LAEEELPKDLKGFKLEKEGGFGLIKKLIILIMVVLVVLYFFKRDWFNLIINSVTGLF
tara:strand:- start:160 stop:333 length:174 start_codon:yes stop_codon:yes gene_type:complete